MDPLTAGLQLANTIAQIVLLGMESQPPEVRAELARAQLDAWKAWVAFLNHLKP